MIELIDYPFAFIDLRILTRICHGREIEDVCLYGSLGDGSHIVS